MVPGKKDDPLKKTNTFTDLSGPVQCDFLFEIQAFLLAMDETETVEFPIQPMILRVI